jgi:hypothetical protein
VSETGKWENTKKRRGKYISKVQGIVVGIFRVKIEAGLEITEKL